MSDADEWRALTAFTPARLALGRAGNGLPTRRVLEFQLAHARARDAVNAPFDAEAIAAALPPSLVLATNAKSRTDYLMNPDLGRSLTVEARAKLKPGAFDAVLVIADGLSATAIQAHGVALAKLILADPVRWAPTVVVRNGRVAIGDEIAQALDAQAAVVMLGERPGLSAADSVGLYLTHRPVPVVTRDADRNCISNVRPAGLKLADAAGRLRWLLAQSRRLGLTGVGLKEDALDLLPDGRAEH